MGGGTLLRHPPQTWRNHFRFYWGLRTTTLAFKKCGVVGVSGGGGAHIAPPIQVLAAFRVFFFLSGVLSLVRELDDQSVFLFSVLAFLCAIMQLCKPTDNFCVSILVKKGEIHPPFFFAAFPPTSYFLDLGANPNTFIPLGFFFWLLACFWPASGVAVRVSLKTWNPSRPQKGFYDKCLKTTWTWYNGQLFAYVWTKM